MNLCANSQVNFVHEIRNFDKLGKMSYEFAQIREGYVTNGLYCKSSVSNLQYKVLKTSDQLIPKEGTQGVK